MRDHTHPRIHAWYDGELAPGDAETIAAHVAACSDCASAAAALRTLGVAMVEPTMRVPAGFAEATRRRALRRRLPEPPLWWLALPVSWRAGLAVLLIVAAIVGVRLGDRLTSGSSDLAELAAAFDSPAANVLTAASAEGNR